MDAKLTKNYKIKSANVEYPLKKGQPISITKTDEERSIYFAETLTKEGIVSGWFPFDIVSIENPSDSPQVKSRKVRASTKYKAEKDYLNTKIAARPAKEALVERGILKEQPPASPAVGRPTISKMLSKSFAFSSTAPKKEAESAPVKKVFGLSLGQVMYTSYTEYKIPSFIVKSLSLIEEKGLKEQGIFRVSGSTLDTNEMKDKIDKGEEPEWAKYDVQSVSSLLKLFFRTLPDPLLTSDLYDVFAKSLEGSDKLGKMREVIGQLPEINRVLLGRLLSLLRKVSAHADVNLMSPSNLGIVFGPTLLWQKNPDVSGDMRANLVGQDVVTFMIENFSSLFPNNDDKKTNFSTSEHKRTPSVNANLTNNNNGSQPQRGQSLGSIPVVEPGVPALSPPVARANPASSTPLPAGWEEKLDPKGRTYYVDRINRKTQWEDPRVTKNA
eukprot:TRINITY_DN1680_c0_g1_i1.p1 TRINITY_DN1680_c0_g1~~TRINITY_DN1680_c0_g1_i1.p1  ORF type:complete len:441 (-),score=147.79 TRINITY_DN1680_c0_g1_i1:65-1387(-)